MKKYPTPGAHLRARTLRRDITDAEKSLWRLLSSGQMEGYRFRRQVPIGPYIADFICHQARLILEVDGGQHDLTSEKEVRRTDFLQSQGYRVLRFWNNEVLGNLEGVYAAIVEVLRHHPHPTLPHLRGRA